MAILRTRHRLISSAPPPSPIATAKGSRSAAVDDKVLSEYLERTLQIPDLTLPEFCFPENARSWIPSRVDLRSLISKDEDSIRQVLGSAAEFGTFLIIGHGISADELQSMLLEAKCVPEIPAEKRRIINRNLNGRGEVHEELFWFCAGEGKKETLREEIGPDRYRRFSKSIDNIESKLEAIADAVGQILFQHKRVQHQLDGINTRGSVICFHRLIANPNVTTTRHEDDEEEREHTSFHHHALLSLHLHPSDQEIDVQTRQGLLSFTAGADTIVVTIGKQLEEWSNGYFKHVTWLPIFNPNIDGYSSIEFMHLPVSLNRNISQSTRIISIVDQIFIALAIAFLYIFYSYISSRFTRK